jgi:hypothetical protein
MKTFRNHLARPLTLLAALISAAFLSIGCSLMDAPTASNDATESTPDLWSPSAGDEVVPGRPIPIIMDEMYWETPGMVNPSVRGLTAAPPINIDGDVGGTVSCGYHNYVVPSGAVDGTLGFTMRLASTQGIGVDCGPSPLSFDVPVRLTLSYAGTQYDPDYCARAGIEPLDASQLEIWYVSPDGAFERVGDGRVFNPGSKTITVNVSHFSRYVIA